MTLRFTRWKPASERYVDRGAVKRQSAIYAILRDGEIVGFIEAMEPGYMVRGTWRLVSSIKGQPGVSARAYAGTLSEAKRKAETLYQA